MDRSPDGLILLMTSTDGFCSVVAFEPGELGEIYSGPIASKFRIPYGYQCSIPLSLQNISKTAISSEDAAFITRNDDMMDSTPTSVPNLGIAVQSVSSNSYLEHTPRPVSVLGKRDMSQTVDINETQQKLGRVEVTEKKRRRIAPTLVSSELLGNNSDSLIREAKGQ